MTRLAFGGKFGKPGNPPKRASLDTKVALARQLRDFEAARKVVDPDDQRQFHLCQAMWSSKYDLDGARAPGVNDAYLLSPEE